LVPGRIELIPSREGRQSVAATQPISDDEALLVEERKARQVELAAKAGVKLTGVPVIHFDHPAASLSAATKGVFAKEITKHIDGEPG
jgi:hypothetical protein